MRIAALDDDPYQLDLVQRAVKEMGYACIPFERSEALLRQLRRDSFDLLIVDWHLPDLSGIEVVRWVRSNIEHALPILFLTNRSEERDIVEGLSAGADDYIVKPMRVQELKARIKALIRRSYPGQENPLLTFGGYQFNMATRTLTFDGQEIELKQKEFDLARCLFTNCGRLLSRKYLLETVWGIDADLPTRSIDTHVSSLRTKLNLRPVRGYRLTAVYGQGYRLEALAEQEDDRDMTKEQAP
ncbi:response regulator transcription factor [Andreprevotia chitinilytica]|uniref:response regulator transcription factor n=1 Tax=Andreprevotia chitinilytica TaxID=396808 RepID=UPI0005559B9E|nr:response regulator transcription factor [Andreprevotia chitinilytica]